MEKTAMFYLPFLTEIQYFSLFGHHEWNDCTFEVVRCEFD